MIPIFFLALYFAPENPKSIAIFFAHYISKHLKLFLCVFILKLNHLILMLNHLILKLFLIILILF